MSALNMARFDLRRGNRSLTLVFMLSLVVFTAWRWHPEAWLRARIDGLARQAGVGLQYRSLGFHGLALRMEGVDLDLPGTVVPVRFERLTVRPAWLGLLTGHEAAQVSVLWHGQGLHFSVVLHGHEAVLHVPDTHMAVGVLAPLWQRAMAVPLPMALAGDIRLHGEAGISLADGRPLHGHVNLAWEHAGADVIGNRLAFGSYRMQGSGKDGHWHFTAAGGAQARLSASASLDASASDARAWALQARGQLVAMPGSPLAGMMGAKPMHFEVSGPVASPHWQLQ